MVFKILSDEHGDEAHSRKQLPYFIKPVKKTWKRSLRAKLARDFRQIIGRLPPKDLHSIRLEHIYSGCTLLVDVCFVKKNHEGDVVPERARYSVIRKIVERVDGTPPYLRRLNVEEVEEGS